MSDGSPPPLDELRQDVARCVDYAYQDQAWAFRDVAVPTLLALLDRLEAAERELKAAEEWARTMEHERDYQLDVVEVDLEARLLAAQQALRDLHNEVDCRIEHGAESGGHLDYVRTQLAAALAAVGRDPQ